MSPSPCPIYFHLCAVFGQNYAKQECILVGCVPPAAVAVPGGSPPGTPTPPQKQTPPGAGTPQDQTPPGTRHPPGPDSLWTRHLPPPGPDPPLWTEFLTHASENITLPQTSFAGGNNRLASHLGNTGSTTDKI